MTEAEWLACTDPHAMQTLLSGQTNWRKRALFACAYCERLANPFNHRCKAEILPQVEAAADGLLPMSDYRKWKDEVTAERLRLAELVAPIPREYLGGEDYLEEQELTPELEATHAIMEALYWCVCFPDLMPYGLDQTLDEWRHWAFTLKTIATRDVPRERVQELLREEEVAQATLFRDIFTYPFRPVAFDPVWCTSDVLLLARGIYEEKAFDRMPILADALQEADCDNADILAHCRNEGPHVRGCWVIDLLR